MDPFRSSITFLVALLFSLLSDHIVIAQCNPETILDFTEPDTLPTVYAGYSSQFVFTVNDVEKDGTLEFVSAEEDHFVVSSDPPNVHLAQADVPLNVTVNITGN